MNGLRGARAVARRRTSYLKGRRLSVSRRQRARNQYRRAVGFYSAVTVMVDQSERRRELADAPNRGAPAWLLFALAAVASAAYAYFVLNY